MKREVTWISAENLRRDGHEGAGVRPWLLGGLLASGVSNLTIVSGSGFGCEICVDMCGPAMIFSLFSAWTAVVHFQHPW